MMIVELYTNIPQEYYIFLYIPHSLFAPPLNMRCIVVWHTSASYYVWLWGDIILPPINNSTIAGSTLYSTLVYCCVYHHHNGNGMNAMAARQMVSAARRG